MKVLTRDEALATLRRSAEAGLVHTVSNNQEGLTYICNCCTLFVRHPARHQRVQAWRTPSPGRRSSTRSTPDLCQGCGLCEDACQFEALAVGETAIVNAFRCVGCGVCVLDCPEGALALVRRPEDEVLPPPVTEDDWRQQRAAARAASSWNDSNAYGTQCSALVCGPNYLTRFAAVC